MDIATPRNVHLSGFYRRSTAVSNTVEKLPLCIDVILEDLKSRYSEIYDLYGQEGIRELENVMRNILALKEEILNDEPFRKLNSSGPDVSFYNEYLIKLTCQDCRPTFLNTIRLYTECYVFRRIWEAFELTKNLQCFDPYKQIKADKLDATSEIIIKMAKKYNTMLDAPRSYENFHAIVTQNLWAGQQEVQKNHEYIKRQRSYLKNITEGNSYILKNDTDAVWNLLINSEKLDNITIDIILDNMGYELFLDFCLADYILTHTNVHAIRFHVKHIPWFVWNTNYSDIKLLLDRMKLSTKSNLQSLANKWEEYLKKSKWQIVTRKFWCLPHFFADMPNVDPWLYKTLKQSYLIILKGDLNFRKAVGDINLNPEITFENALVNFHPTNIFAIRVLKTGVVCGLSEEDMNKTNPEQCYGFLLFSAKKENLKGIFD